MLGSARSQEGQITRWVLTAFFVIILAIAMWVIRDILMLVLTSVIFAILLTSPIRFFVKRGVRRPVAIVITLILLIALIAGTAGLLLPGLLDQFRQLVTIYIPSAAEQLQSELQPENLVARYPFLQGIDLKDFTDQVSKQFLGGLASISSEIVPFVGSLASTLLTVLFVIFLGMYFIADPETHQQGMIKLFPIRYRLRAHEILGKLDKTLRSFLQAQLVLMLLIGVSTGIALWMIGVPLAGALGTITGLFSFVPNFGPLVALIPILAVALINTPEKLVLVVVVFYVLQFLQSQVITPLLLGQEIHLPPAVILLSQIIAGIFFGFLGVLLSVPLAAILMVLVREIYIKDILGDVAYDHRRMDMEMETDGV
jgi:predicted PurR-regulated permease PerM